MLTEYYRIDARGVSTAECRRMSRGFIASLFAVSAQFCGGLRFNFNIPKIDCLQVVDFEDLPKNHVSRFRDAVKDVEKFGYSFEFLHKIPSLIWPLVSE